MQDDISVREHNFSNHVIVIFPAREVAHPLELGNFVLPLRASSFRYRELKDIVILVRDVEFLRKTWEDISNFPNIYVYEVVKTLSMVYFITNMFHYSRKDTSRSNNAVFPENYTFEC